MQTAECLVCLSLPPPPLPPRQCALLNEKLDSLVKALSEEAEAQVTFPTRVADVCSLHLVGKGGCLLIPYSKSALIPVDKSKQSVLTGPTESHFILELSFLFRVPFQDTETPLAFFTHKAMLLQPV